MLLEPLKPVLDYALAHGITDPEAIAELFSDEIGLQILQQHEAERADELYGKFRNLFPDMDKCKLVSPEGFNYRQVGEFRFFAREHYQKHLEFFRLGKTFRARCFMAANRVGKTFSAGGYELACHLTGDYPPWWEGKRFRAPIRAWACGKTNETTRDIVQTTLLGDVEYHGARKMVDGSGVIPRELIGVDSGQLTWKQGVQDLIDTIKIRHKPSGGWSKLGLKSYQQGRGSFEGTAQHVIWDDEEPPMEVYGEQIIRTATTKGILMLTFTPLEGMSDVVQQFQDADEFFG
jgi:phage terminase large subunit-like protein